MDDARVFAKFPVLHTQRLVLRELRDDDVPAAFAMFADKEVMRYIGHHPHQNLEETREWLGKNRALFPSHEGVRWVLALRENDKFIGSAGHWRMMKEHHRAEIGYDLSPDYWGKGYMKEALTAILRFGFVEMELHSTEAQIDPANQRSRAVLQGLGFRQDGVIRENFFFEGKYTDTVIFTLLAREFLKDAA